MKSLIYLTALSFLLFCCGQKKKKEYAQETPVQKEQHVDSLALSTTSVYRLLIITAPGNTFGYDIYKGEVLFIHQPHIPGLAGVKGFDREAQAKKAAEMMIDKLNKDIVPPTLSEGEITDILKNN